MITFRTVTGRVLDLERPSELSLGEIACGLARICRYTGQVDRFYSVAQHSNLVASLVDNYPTVRAFARLHDASEAVLGDVSRNLKHHPLMGGYRQLEHLWTVQLEKQFGFYDKISDFTRNHVKLADDLAAIFERAVLRTYRPWDPEVCIDEALADGWVDNRRDSLLWMAPRLPQTILHQNPYDAERAFVRGLQEDGLDVPGVLGRCRVEIV